MQIENITGWFFYSSNHGEFCLCVQVCLPYQLCDVLFGCLCMTLWHWKTTLRRLNVESYAKWDDITCIFDDKYEQNFFYILTHLHDSLEKTDIKYILKELHLIIWSKDMDSKNAIHLPLKIRSITFLCSTNSFINFKTLKIVNYWNSLSQSSIKSF